jgi:hypothetical protein
MSFDDESRGAVHIDFLDEDEEDWEDRHTYEQLLAKKPEGWVLIKVIRYSSQTLIDMREWLTKNTCSPYREVNWYGYCSYSTGVMFADEVEAVLFKLRWSA